jgi:biotin operon repressor
MHHQTPALQASRSLELPVSGQALRLSLERHDSSVLQDCAQQLRVAGYRVDTTRLARELLEQGCSWVEDSFGKRVSLHVHVPKWS